MNKMSVNLFRLVILVSALFTAAYGIHPRVRTTVAQENAHTKQAPVPANVFAATSSGLQVPKWLFQASETKSTSDYDEGTSTATMMNTTYGPVQGYVVDGVRIFQGIPFAAPPVEALRFKSPQPPQPWTAVLQTLKPGPSCPTFELTTTIVLGQEDCLYLDVYIPEAASETNPVPVMIWIHGGGFVLGNSYHGGLFDGQKYAREHGVIVVSMNYRLNVFGFLAQSYLQAADSNNSTGNFGMQDQRLAMQWVADNIKELGGDATKRLLFGQSAGGVSVCYHVTAPASRGLFTRAIMESGSCESAVFFRPLDKALAFGDLFTTATGCNSSLPAQEYILCLQSVPTTQLMDPLMRDFSPEWPNKKGSFKPLPGIVPPLAPPMPFGPVIDGTDVGLPDVPLTMIKNGNWAKIPFMMGTNLNEGTVFVPLAPVVTHDAHYPLNATGLEVVFNHFIPNATLAKEAMSYYQPGTAAYPTPDAAGAQFLTDWFFACGTRRTAKAVEEVGGQVWLYYFSYPGHWFDFKVFGDYHSSELYFVWGNQFPKNATWHEFNAEDDALSKVFQTYWASHAYNGNPNGNVPGGVTVTDWAQFDPTELNLMDMSGPNNTMSSHFRSTVCDFWDTVPYV